MLWDTYIIVMLALKSCHFNIMFFNFSIFNCNELNIDHCIESIRASYLGRGADFVVSILS